MFQVVKRDGELDEFKIGKITAAIHKAFDAKEKNYSEEMIDLLGLRVTSDFQKKISDNKITVEEIQDSVENVLIQAGYADVAKAYILYRKQREKVIAPGEQPDYSQEELLAFLQKRKGILDGVCISGGEPTLSDGLEGFLEKIKELGYAVKLDTNGSRPKIVKHLAEAGLIDKVAMDIKACPDNYANLTGVEKPDMDSIFETADFLLHGTLDYEFRTTVVRELHTQKDFEEISQWLKGAKEYYLQAYKDSDGVLKPGYGSYTFEELQEFQKILQKTILSVGIRGID